MGEVTFRIRRFNPEKDAEPYWQEYRFEPPAGATLLDCLNHIKWHLDGTLTYRMSCRSAICGSCAMKVNGGGQLVCNAQWVDYVQPDGTITIEPVGNLPVIKDLVVDQRPFWEKIEAVRPYLENDQPPETGEFRMSPADFEQIDEASTCILCSACYSECVSYEVDKNFLGPAALAKAQRFVYDTRDQATEERLKQLSEAGGIWDCAHCFNCVQACPKPTKPLWRILQLRQAAHRHGFHDNNGWRHAHGFVEIVEESGWLDEAKLPLKSVGTLKEIVSDLLPVGLRMGLKGKYRPNPLHLLPGMHHPEIPKMDEVRRLIEKARAQAATAQSAAQDPNEE